MSPDRLDVAYGALLINGVPLIELLREVERPLVAAELAERVAAGADPAGLGPEPGSYMWLPGFYRLPSRQLFGEPERLGFVLAEDDPQQGKAMLVGCDCGNPECWFVTARIELRADTVEWSDFRQFHRDDWHYPLGPYVFDRAQYTAALAPLPG